MIPIGNRLRHAAPGEPRVTDRYQGVGFAWRIAPSKGAEDDIITVYSTIEGEKSYDTQIGGETYVPQTTAKYVVE